MADGNKGNEQAGGSGNGSNGSKEWWQPSEKMPAFSQTQSQHAENMADVAVTSKSPRVNGQTPTNGINKANTLPDAVQKKTPGSQREDLPSWLTEQPISADMSMLRPSALSNTAKIPSSPPPKPLAEWQPTTPPPQAKSTDQLPRKQATGPQKTMTKSGDMGNRRTGSPEWQPPAPNGLLQSLAQARKTSDALALSGLQESGSLPSSPGRLGSTPRTQKRNYPALVTALQTLGYGIPGFVAAAVVNLDGQPIAQVAIDELDIAHMCGYFSTILQGVLLSLEDGKWGQYEDVVISSTERHILLRIINAGAFQVLITSRESDPGESLEVMANVESAISAAL